MSRETMKVSDTCVVRLYDEHGNLKAVRDTSKPSLKERISAQFALFIEKLRKE